MRPLDLDDVLSIERASFSMPWSRGAFLYEMEQNQVARCFVGREGGRVVGYVCVWEVADELSRRLIKLFLRNGQGQRPFNGSSELLQKDPLWRDYILFYEYFHGDEGAGIGASHQTGWTGVIATLINVFGRINPEEFLAAGKEGGFAKGESHIADLAIAR